MTELEQRLNFTPLPNARKTVDYRFDVLNWDFLKGMSMIGSFADVKYAENGGALQYVTAEALKGDKSPVNHIAEHLRQFQAGELHKHYKTRKAQLWAIAYNAMMAAHYLEDDPDYCISPLSRTKGQEGQ